MDWQASDVQSKLKVFQAIYASLIGGAGVFALVALVIAGQGGAGGTADLTILRIVWAALFVSMVIAVVVIRLFSASAAGKQIGEGASADAYFTPFFVTTILKGAMLEGTSLFGGIILLLGGQAPDVAMAIVPLAVMLPFFPTRGSFEKFIDRATGREREEGLTAPTREF